MQSNHDTFSFYLGYKKISRFFFIVSYLIAVAGYSSLVLGWEYNCRSRTDAIALTLAPAFVFILCHYIFEKQAAMILLKKEFWGLSFITLAGMIVLPALFAFRFDIDRKIIQLMEIKYSASRSIALSVLFLLAVNIIVFIMKQGNDTNILLKLILHVKKIMWDIKWYDEDLDNSRIAKSRSFHYRDKSILGDFQDTLTCQDNDAYVVNSLLLYSPLKTISILDIGGGEGKLTSNILKTLSEKRNQISELVMVDPVDWKREYIENVKDVIPELSVKVIQKPFEAFDEKVTYDLVIASHSLYACFDLNNREKKNEIIGKMLSYRADGGIAIIVLASIYSRAYNFKNSALNYIYGKEIKDLTAEEFKQYICEPVVEIRQDDLFDLGDYLELYDQGYPDKITNWLSYFLRVDIKSLNDQHIGKIVKILKWHVVKLPSLSESEVTHYIELAGITKMSQVLPHKVIIHAIKK